MSEAEWLDAVEERCNQYLANLDTEAPVWQRELAEEKLRLITLARKGLTLEARVREIEADCIEWEKALYVALGERDDLREQVMIMQAVRMESAVKDDAITREFNRAENAEARVKELEHEISAMADMTVTLARMNDD